MTARNAVAYAPPVGLSGGADVSHSSTVTGNGHATANGTTRVRSVLAERTLVLNVTYQPLSITTVRKALLLVLAGKADVIHSGSGRIRSPRMSIAAPSVVRLNYHARAPYRRRAPLHRRAVFARDSYRCQYCGDRAECIDHVHPRSRGGEHTWENVVACCRACNVGKGDSLLGDGRFRLRHVPYAPEPLAVVAAMRGGAPQEWKDYLPKLRGQLV
ncbi:HNH endonuclease [Candidatus Poriferisodalis sp.]|uniref:HNH endonuclease n=1 Tax=Candidatus Poriferisodalis sp. TaxID=3101277 RepID=UPI003B0275E3